MRTINVKGFGEANENSTFHVHINGGGGNNRKVEVVQECSDLFNVQEVWEDIVYYADYAEYMEGVEFDSQTERYNYIKTWKDHADEDGLMFDSVGIIINFRLNEKKQLVYVEWDGDYDTCCIYDIDDLKREGLIEEIEALD